MKLVKLLGTSMLLVGLIASSFNIAHAETTDVHPQVGKTNVSELMNKAGTFYYQKFIAGTEEKCDSMGVTCTYLPDPQQVNHNMTVKVNGQAGQVNLQEVMLEHLGEDILTNQTSSKPETRYTSVYGISQTNSKTTTVNKGFVLPNSVNNVLVAADIAGIGKETFNFDLNKSESVSDSTTETINTSPQAYTVNPHQVIKVVTELYALEYDGTVEFKAETEQNDINFEIQAHGAYCMSMPSGGTICAHKDRTFNKDFTILYDNLDEGHKQELENGGMLLNTKVPGAKKIPYFKGLGEFKGLGGHRVVTKDYDITDPNNPILLGVRSQDI
ncbi:ETX/MTX2 family pore-forming toxin [Enterococcus faecalis]|nr:ETX/MTX2 family pore-forming toxin [Enterococcus faecalis]